MSYFKQQQQQPYYPMGSTKLTSPDQGLPVLPTGEPTGPRYSPYPVNPEAGVQPAQRYPDVMPSGCQCPPPADMQNGMHSRPMTPSGAVAQMPGIEFSNGEQSPLTTINPLYTPGFLRTQIGKTVRVEFLIGTTGLVDRFGKLVGVGTSYILIQEAMSDDIILCDIYSIKFVRFYL